MMKIENVMSMDDNKQAIIDIRECFVISKTNTFAKLKDSKDIAFYYEKNDCFFDLCTIKQKLIAMYRAIVFIYKI